MIIGKYDDAPTNPIIQPPGVVANQSLRKGDQQLGGRGSDVLVGRLGPDTQTIGRGGDVIVGGTERGSDVAAFPRTSPTGAPSRFRVPQSTCSTPFTRIVTAC